jgi:hypothetical protein
MLGIATWSSNLCNRVLTVKVGLFQIKLYYLIPLNTVAGFVFGSLIKAIYNEHS